MLINVLALVALFTIPICIQLLLVGTPLMMADAADARGLSWSALLGACTAMLIGIVLGATYERLKTVSGDLSFRRDIVGVFRQAGLYRALIASPLVFGGTYAATVDTVEPIIGLAFAFQNGFFCEAIMRKTTTSMNP